MCKVPFCHPQYNKKAVFLEFYCLLSIYFWGRVFDNLGGAGEQIKILGHLFTPAMAKNKAYQPALFILAQNGINLRKME